MKKKLLSLVLAGAMVASTSVSAFAATESATHGQTSIQEGKSEQDVPVKIVGNILDDQGNAKPGTINVSVPTATSFSVNGESGELVSPDMTITNNSQEKIKVIASKFEDPNGTDEINVITKTAFGDKVAEKERGTIWLRLKGGSKSFGLTTEGKIYDANYVSAQESEDARVIDEVNGGGSLTLTLEGEGGIDETDTKPASKAIKDDFKLVLKIARAQ